MLESDGHKAFAWRAWMAAAEGLRPDLFESVDDVNAISADFESWWKKQIDQCLHVVACSKSDGYLCCVLPRNHDGDHRVDDGAKGDEVPGAAWITYDQFKWRHRRLGEP